MNSRILSVECDENVNAYRFNTRLVNTSISEAKTIITFSTTATCCVDFTLQSTATDKGIKFDLREVGTECDCICAYDFVVQLDSVLNPKTKFYVKNVELKKGIPKLRPYKKKYFVFENDTTGLDDENGLRQGYIVFKRKNDLRKVYYQDGKFIKLEITDFNGKVLITETDENKMFDY